MPSTQPPKSRRNVLSMLLGGTLATVLAPVLYVVTRYLIPPQTLPSTAIVGPESSIPAGAARAIKVGVTDAVVMRDARGAVYALDLRCTHAGCNVAWHAPEGE